MAKLNKCLSAVRDAMMRAMKVWGVKGSVRVFMLADPRAARLFCGVFAWCVREKDYYLT